MSEQPVPHRSGYRNTEYAAQLDEQIQTQRTNLMISFGVSLCVLSLGGFATLYLIKTAGIAGVAPEYLKLGPIALSSISLPFPLRMYFSYRVRLPIYRRLKRCFDEASKRGEEPDPELVDDAQNALKALHKLD